MQFLKSIVLISFTAALGSIQVAADGKCHGDHPRLYCITGLGNPGQQMTDCKISRPTFTADCRAPGAGHTLLKYCCDEYSKPVSNDGVHVKCGEDFPGCVSDSDVDAKHKAHHV
ncbi:hypothetical protein PTTG_11899 [Puccinia triticina 1-1 BBBD Race 1]|uniref:Uncharacterized protein n=2 Tax=Puccinia triticina TaxID=208348 RepID=A0A180GJC9_PUCT1|nr:uncharacterized protein PtA15_14A258 [Puccinia triticina]OAV92887.1 hypothetical protein PTTG_11899 [Puccinia triticina 1-1 BBBD Race 1]WAQ91375.1 hypothetical protein PtA15_14A258 [Puccinia triticina]WAR62176.1 hypothetical protein PtB15_14B270 [Puccinia triticina]